MAARDNDGYDGGIPQEWGPGPWDFESRGWAAANRFGNLRAWREGDPTDLARQPLMVVHGLTGFTRPSKGRTS